MYPLLLSVLGVAPRIDLFHTHVTPMEKQHKKQHRQQNHRPRNQILGQNQVDLVRIPRFIQPNPIRRITKRWVSTAAFAAQTFTQSDLYNQFLVVVATTGNAIPYADMIRIRKIRAFVQGAAGAAFTIQPLSGDVNNQFASPERTYTIQCNNPSAPCQSLVIKPRGPDDPLGGWKETSNAGFATALLVASWVNGTTGLTIEMDFDYIENWIGGPNGYAVLTTTTVLGTIGGRTILSNMNVSGSNQL
jgi:hypothetical protein